MGMAPLRTTVMGWLPAVTVLLILLSNSANVMVEARLTNPVTDCERAVLDM